LGFVRGHSRQNLGEIGVLPKWKTGENEAKIIETETAQMIECQLPIKRLGCVVCGFENWCLQLQHFVDLSINPARLPSLTADRQAYRTKAVRPI
jgi:hypothetical protein